MSTYYVAGVPYSSELYHHGIKGQRWGIRRFQNPDRSLTPAGKERYRRLSNKLQSKEEKLEKAKSRLDASVAARKAYKDAKADKGVVKDSAFYAKKELAKRIGTRRQIRKNVFNLRQAQWERDTAKNKVNKLIGKDPIPVAKISPKAKKVGAIIASELILVVGGMALGNVLFPASPGTVTTYSTLMYSK